MACPVRKQRIEDWRLRIKGATRNPDLPQKRPLKQSVYVTIIMTTMTAMMTNVGMMITIIIMRLEVKLTIDNGKEMFGERLDSSRVTALHC